MASMLTKKLTIYIEITFFDRHRSQCRYKPDSTTKYHHHEDLDFDQDQLKSVVLMAHLSLVMALDDLNFC